MESVIIIVIGVFVLFCVIMLILATISNKRNESIEKKRIADNYVKIMKDLRVPEAWYSNISDDISILTASDNIKSKLKEMSNTEFEKFKKKNGISTTVDTKSSLGICGVTKNAFIYNIGRGTSNDIINGGFRFGCSFSSRPDRSIDMPIGYNSYEYYLKLKSKIEQLSNAGYDSVLFDNVIYYDMEGTLQYTANVSGGGNDPTAAMKGALLMGTTGAIIGAAAGQKEIKTTTEKHDNRKIMLCYKANGQDRIMHITSEDPDFVMKTLQSMMPDKYYPLVANKNDVKPTAVAATVALAPSNTAKTSANPSANIDVQKIRELSELLKDGIITQEEFDSAKKQLLNS